MEPYVYESPSGATLRVDISGVGAMLKVTGRNGGEAWVPVEPLAVNDIAGKLHEACGLPSPVILERSSARFPEDGTAFRFGEFGFRLYPEGVAPSLPGIVAKAVPPAALRELAAHLIALADHAEAVPLATIRRAVTAMRADAERCGDKPGSFVAEVADWLGIEAAAIERKLPDDSGSVHVALKIARAYLGEGI
jgi:hypothetical protein